MGRAYSALAVLEGTLRSQLAVLTGKHGSAILLAATYGRQVFASGSFLSATPLLVSF